MTTSFRDAGYFRGYADICRDRKYWAMSASATLRQLAPRIDSSNLATLALKALELIRSPDPLGFKGRIIVLQPWVFEKSWIIRVGML